MHDLKALFTVLCTTGSFFFQRFQTGPRFQILTASFAAEIASGFYLTGIFYGIPGALFY